MPSLNTFFKIARLQTLLSMKLNRRRFIQTGIIAAGGAILLGTYSVFIERYHLQINHYRIDLPRLPEAFERFRILQLADLHYGPYQRWSYIEKALEKATGIQCDLIALTGDYMHKTHDPKKVRQMWKALNQLKAPGGVFNVLGNHDHWAGHELAMELLETSGQSLRKKTTTLTLGNDRMHIGGAGDLWEDHFEIAPVFKNVPDEEFRILLAHNPDSVDTIEGPPMDLILSGHTHGGQIVLPFIGALKLPVKNKTYNQGLIPTKNGPVFISRGIGTAILPIRFNCPPEIAILELRRPRHS